MESPARPAPRTCALVLAALLLASAAARAGEPLPAPAVGPASVEAAPQAGDPDGAMRRADEAFRNRDDPRQLAASIAGYREAVRARGGDPVPLLALARAEAFRARSIDAEARDAWSECARAAESALRILAPGFRAAVDRGDDAARAAARVDARGAEALYWLALGTMRFAQERGISAVLSVRDAARAMMERAEHLDERVDHGGPPRALGAWLASLPSAAGGGAAAARGRFERARALAPGYQLTRVLEAQTLAVLLQDRAGFDARLGEVLAFDPARAPEIAPENRVAQRRARSLLARRDRLF